MDRLLRLTPGSGERRSQRGMSIHETLERAPQRGSVEISNDARAQGVAEGIALVHSQAAQALSDTFVPVDHAIVGIVDEVATLPGAEGGA